ncbi:hypothetical protein DPMN_111825 [Dreissena polymorpha]|uniref:Uncharacterized protein n=1 Tax=Dreissena polymorpha TaxID=45954 RepID=A0A9D4KEZ7_DREPO|nr:hypothetical protein DPMN_111825 [Dreissena polymorpha]
MSSLMTSSRFHPCAAAPMRGLYGGGRDHTSAADPEVVSPAEVSRTSGETVHTSREVKTPRHSLPVPGPMDAINGVSHGMWSSDEALKSSTWRKLTAHFVVTYHDGRNAFKIIFGILTKDNEIVHHEQCIR